LCPDTLLHVRILAYQRDGISGFESLGGSQIILPGHLPQKYLPLISPLCPVLAAGDDETFRRSKDVYGCTVDLSRVTTHMRENAEAGKPSSEQPGDPVRDCDIDFRQPSFAEPHHEHA
jgi:hypothetical protein